MQAGQIITDNKSGLALSFTNVSVSVCVSRKVGGSKLDQCRTLSCVSGMDLY